MSGCFCWQAEDGIRDLVRSRGLGDVYKRQPRGPEAGSADGRLGRRLQPAQQARAEFSEEHGADDDGAAQDL